MRHTAKIIPFPRHDNDCIEGRLRTTLNAIRRRDRDLFLALMKDAQERGDVLNAFQFAQMAMRMSVE